MTPPPATAAAARQHARPARTTRPAPGPRRVSGPARRPAAVPRPAHRELPFGARVLDFVRALPDHRAVDRLLSGRVWIALIGTLLVGIVTLQLSLLKLNAGIGRAVESGGVLEQSNAALSAEISQLSDPQRIVDIATHEGFVLPPQGSPRFVTASAGAAQRALTVMRVPQQSATTSVSATTLATGTTTPVSATTTPDPAAATADPTAAAGTMTTVPSTATTTGQTATPGATAPAPSTPAAPSGATTAGTAAAGGAAAPQG